MKMEKIIGFILLYGILLSCSSETINRKPLSDGERLFRAKCRSCQILPDPQKHNDTEWVKIMEKYGERARLKEKEKLAILNFLQTQN